MYLMTGINASELTIKRLYVADSIHDDKFAVIRNGEVIGEVGHVQARLFWLGRLSPCDLLSGDSEAGDML